MNPHADRIEQDDCASPEADARGRRLLVVAGAAAADPESVPTLVLGLLEAASQILVITPVLPTRLQWWVSDTGRARVQADARLGAVLGHLEQLEVAAAGRVGDETPLTVFVVAGDE